MSEWIARPCGTGSEREAGGFRLAVTDQSNRGCGWCWHVSLTDPDHNGEICEIAAGAGLDTRRAAQLAAEQYARDFCSRTFAVVSYGASFDGETLRKALVEIAFELELELKTRGPEPVSERPVKRAIEIARHALAVGQQV